VLKLLADKHLKTTTVSYCLGYILCCLPKKHLSTCWADWNLFRPGETRKLF